ncbi:MAG TPA: M56 family metallopeptidase, partial [Longimicrobiaceae bacterium]|nr:M56 family metallopeptidase [Longimicrobiaceae bacterium]
MAALLGIAALAAERVAGWLGLPRRAAWATAMLGSLLLPALSLLAPGLLPDLGIFPVAAPSLPAMDAGALPLATNGSIPSVDGVAAGPEALWNDPTVLFGLGWLAASLAMLGVVAWTYGRLRTAREQAVPVELDGGEVRVSAHAGPAVVGLLRPAIVVPRWILNAPEEERRLILLHEREHVAAGDAWLLFVGIIAVAVMPWSVPLWWQHRRLRAAVEADCDARVLARGVGRREYGRVLIRTAGCSPGLPHFGPAWGDSTSQLERRIIAMTPKRPSHPLLRSLPLLAFAAGVVATACDVAGEGGDGSPTVLTAPARTGQTAGAVAHVPHTIVTDTMAADQVDRSELMQPTASLGWYLSPNTSPARSMDELLSKEFRAVSRL